MTGNSFENIDCGIAQALAVIGEWWTILILRNSFSGMRTFDQFQEHLGISSSVLSTRLKTLVDAGVLKKVRSDSDGRSFEYRLTELGLEFYPILVGLAGWGEKLAPNSKGERTTLLEKSSGTRIAGVAVLSRDGKQLKPWDVLPEAGPGADEKMRSLLAPKDHAAANRCAPRGRVGAKAPDTIV